MEVSLTVATIVWSSMITNPTSVRPKRITCSLNPVTYSAFSGISSVSLLAIASGGTDGDSELDAMAGAGRDGAFALRDNEALLSDERSLIVFFKRKVILVSRVLSFWKKKSIYIRVL